MKPKSKYHPRILAYFSLFFLGPFLNPKPPKTIPKPPKNIPFLYKHIFLNPGSRSCFSSVHLLELSLGLRFDQALENLPPKLQRLSLGDEFNQSTWGRKIDKFFWFIAILLYYMWCFLLFVLFCFFIFLKNSWFLWTCLFVFDVVLKSCECCVFYTTMFVLCVCFLQECLFVEWNRLLLFCCLSLERILRGLLLYFHWQKWAAFWFFVLT